MINFLKIMMNLHLILNYYIISILHQILLYPISNLVNFKQLIEINLSSKPLLINKEMLLPIKSLLYEV